MVLEGGEGNSAFIMRGNGTQEGESKHLIGREMVLGTCSVHTLMWEMVRREKFLRNCPSKDNMLSSWGKKVLERGDMSFSGKICSGGESMLPKGDYDTGEKKYVPLLGENALRRGNLCS